MVFRVRHVSIPDIPPRYPPYETVSRLRELLVNQIACIRKYNTEKVGQAPEDSEFNKTFVLRHDPIGATKEPRKWINANPTVVSFTPRPTYSTPQFPRNCSDLKQPLRVTFPRPPEWNPVLWRPAWEKVSEGFEVPQNLLSHVHKPAILYRPQSPASYFGPGLVLLRPVIDINSMKGGTLEGQAAAWYKALLEKTTLGLLKGGFGIEGFTVPGRLGIWVNAKTGGATEADQKDTENMRRIATIDNPTIEDGISRGGVSIHVGQPGFDHPDEGEENPWDRFGAATTMTSIAAHLASMKPASPIHQDDGANLVRNIQLGWEHWDLKADPSKKHVLYTVSQRGSQRRTAPLGMDNHQIGVNWTHEFARQMGADVEVGDVVEHAMIVNSVHNKPPFWVTAEINSTTWRPVPRPNLPSLARAGSESSKAFQETLRIEKHEDAHAEKLGSGDRMPSWPLFVGQIDNLLRKSLRAQHLDLLFMYSHKLLSKDSKRKPRPSEPGLPGGTWVRNTTITKESRKGDIATHDLGQLPAFIKRKAYQAKNRKVKIKRFAEYRK